MSKENRISKLLNEVWHNFIKNESEIVKTDNLQTLQEPSEEEQKFFTILLKSCQKDMRDWMVPRELIYWRRSSGDEFFTVGWLDRDECVMAFYTIDVEEDIVKRWPKEPTHWQMFEP